MKLRDDGQDETDEIVANGVNRSRSYESGDAYSVAGPKNPNGETSEDVSRASTGFRSAAIIGSTRRFIRRRDAPR